MSAINFKDHISICICTYKRPNYLARLLVSINHIVTDDAFTISIVIVDNDVKQSGKPVFDAFSKISIFPIKYFFEKEKSISLARNKSVKNAQGNLIAFIDDDEFPDQYWLLNLYKAYRRLGVDGILGPVKPHFESTPPRWIVEGRICERKEFPTGTLLLDKRDTRTGNALVASELFASKEPFDPKYGVTGGGDAEFFRVQMLAGRRFKWCNEAIVYETVIPERQTRNYYIKRAFTRGLATARVVPPLSLLTFKSFFALILYTSFLPIGALTNEGLFMQYFIKECDHLSKLLSYAGIHIVKARPY